MVIYHVINQLLLLADLLRIRA